MNHLTSGLATVRTSDRTLATATPLKPKISEHQADMGGTGIEYYNAVFASSVAEGTDQRLDCFRIRFQVYCIDNAFEDPEDNPGGLETDAYDSHSAHSLLTHRSTGNAIGTVRLVLPSRGGSVSFRGKTQYLVCQEHRESPTSCVFAPKADRTRSTARRRRAAG